MIQGPWGCNQMIRNYVGGNYAVPGQWGNALLLRSSGWGGPAITSAAMSGTMMPINHGFTYDHRLTGPYGSQAMVPYQAPMVGNGTMMAGPAMITNGPMIASDPMICDDGWAGCDDGYYDSRRSRRRHKSYNKYKYKYTDKPATNCTVM
jgi:hypothetical protein